MFFRARQRGPHKYLQIVENNRVDGKVVQKVLLNLGRLDMLQRSGSIESLLQSGAKFSERLMILDAHAKGDTLSTDTLKIGPVLLLEKLWRESGIKGVIHSFLVNRRFDFPVERAIFVTVMHRLFSPGSDRAAERWMRGYQIEGVATLGLHHFYRAMAWLGQVLPQSQQADAPPFSPRCVKDAIEEHLFASKQDLFSALSIVFFDTTSLYFEGAGGMTIGRHGNSKDHRPDLAQMVVGVVLDDKGNPIFSQLWPGNVTDVKTLLPIAQRLKRRFGVQRICLVADRGMISKETIEELERENWLYILGVRMRRTKEARDNVLSRPGRYAEIFSAREKSTDPAPLKVKEVWVDKRRYIVCLDEEEERKDRHDREAILSALREQIKQGDKSLIGNKGYRKFVKSSGAHFEIDEDKVLEEQRYDGKWVLRTNTDYDAATVAMQYKQLWSVEDIFRTMKSTLDTRPIFHHFDETIRGHVFCSFLALVLRKHLHDKLAKREWKLEWANVVEDVDALEQTTITHQQKRFVLRNEVRGVAGKVFQAAEVALPSVLRTADSLATTPVPCS